MAAGGKERKASLGPRVDPLTPAEQQWIQTQLANARRFVEGFAHSGGVESVSLSTLDQAFSAWLTSSQSRSDIALTNEVINYVGVAFGQHIIEALGFRWVIATDEQGSELAVYGLPGQGDVIIYPTNFVAKRWEGGETSFLERSYEQIASDVQKIQDKYGSG